MITERLMGPGQWSVTLSPETPRHVMEKLSLAKSGLAHIVITPTHIDSSEFSDSQMLALARFTGVYRKRTASGVLSGAGLASWLGDEDGKGDILAAPTAQSTFAGWIGALRPSYFVAGVTSTISGTFSKTFQRVTRRSALDEVCAFYGAEWRVRPDFTFDAGTRSALFLTTPRAVIVKRKADAGPDAELTGIVGDLETEEDVESWVRSVLYYFDNNRQVHEPNGGVADADVPFRNPTGGQARVRSVVESSTEATGEAAGLAAAAYGEVKDPRRTLRLSAEEYDVGRDLAVGDDVFVFDPDEGLVDTGNQVDFRGETIFPVKIRCVGYSWPVRLGMGVYLRRWVKPASTWVVEWVDITEYVEWESGSGEVEVGALPRRLSIGSGGVSRTEYGQILDDLADTGWVDITVTSGFAAQSPSEHPMVRRIGNVVHVRGGWASTGLTANAALVVGTIPTGFRPAVSAIGSYGGATGAQTGVLRFNTNGNVEIRTGATAPGYAFPSVSSWLIN